MCYAQVSSPGLADHSLKNEPEIDTTGYIFYKNKIQLDTWFTKTRYNWTQSLQNLDTIGHMVYKNKMQLDTWFTETRCNWMYCLQKPDDVGHILYKNQIQQDTLVIN